MTLDDADREVLALLRDHAVMTFHEGLTMDGFALLVNLSKLVHLGLAQAEMFESCMRHTITPAGHRALFRIVA